MNAILLCLSLCGGGADTLNVGQPAPPFTLVAHSGEKVALNDLEFYWVALFFFREDHMDQAAILARGFQGNHYENKDARIRVMAISNGSPKQNKAFASENNLSFPVLSDPPGRIAAQFGFTSASSCCTTILIDPMGKVARIERGSALEIMAETVLSTVHARTRTIDIPSEQK